MKMSGAFPGKYFAAADLDEPLVVVIAHVDEEDVSGGQGHPAYKPVVYFRGQKQGLALNQTNAQTLADLHGDESDDWEGCQCELYQDTTEYMKKMVPCVRIRAVKTDDADARLQREADAAGADPLQ